MTAEASGGLYGSATLTYDPEDRLASVSSPGFSAGYDGDGGRAYKTARGSVPSNRTTRAVPSIS